jgi:hypothetical protein
MLSAIDPDVFKLRSAAGAAAGRSYVTEPLISCRRSGDRFVTEMPFLGVFSGFSGESRSPNFTNKKA